MRAAVLGSPIAHSLSPLLHRAAYDALGLPDWTYDAVDVQPAALGDFLDGLGPEWAGLSLTMPLKQAVLPLLTARSELVVVTGAANTVLLAGGGRQGENTDVAGLVAALVEVGVTGCRSPVVLGGGATARSALAAVSRLGATRVRLVVRSEPADARVTAAALGLEVEVRPWGPDAAHGCDLLVSTVPAAAQLAVDSAELAVLADVPVLLDVGYAPWPTPLARACSGRVVGGRDLLLHQAARQVELMTGRPAPLTAMRYAMGAAPPAA